MGFVISGIALYQERKARREEAQFRKLAQVATAWELLLTRASGDIGTGNAVNTIIAAEGQLEDADYLVKARGSSEMLSAVLHRTIMMLCWTVMILGEWSRTHSMRWTILRHSKLSDLHKLRRPNYLMVHS